MTAYYTDDITLMPVRVIWRICHRNGGLASWLNFLQLLVRKSLRRRYPATFGVCHVQEITPLPADQIPSEVHALWSTGAAACAAAGFRLAFFFRPPYIGQKRAYWAVYLHEGGTVWATQTWLQITLGAESRFKVVFGCHSKSISGIEFHTSPVPPEHWHPELVPDYQRLQPLPPETSEAETIRIHFQRLEGLEDLEHFDVESLRCEIAAASGRVLRHHVKTGLYSPLTPVEVARLTQV